MKLFTHWLISQFLFGATMFFAGSADVLGAAEGVGDGAIDSPEVGIGEDGLDGANDSEDRPASGSDDVLNEDEQRESAQRPSDQKEEPELKNFAGLASSRLRGLIKVNAKMAEVFKESPEIQQKLEAVFRRDAAFRDAFPTVAEANALREALPNGLQDLKTLQADVAEVEQLDRDFYNRDREGNYPGHAKIIGNMFQDDREAAISLFRSLPKEWARLDPGSYREVMGQIIGATLRQREIPQFVGDLIEDAKAAKHDGLVQGLTRLLNWTQGFTAEKARPTPEEERLASERAHFNREKSQRDQEDTQRFNSNFKATNLKLQRDVIKTHPAIQKLLGNKAIGEQKKADIIEQVRQQIEKLLAKSPSFMRKLRPAYQSRNIEEAVTLQKAAWSQPWLLNRMVRTVMSKEVPQMVSQNRESVRRRAGAPATKQPVRSGERKDAALGTLPAKQVQGRWYRDGGRGAAFTTAEVLAGKHTA